MWSLKEAALHLAGCSEHQYGAHLQYLNKIQDKGVETFCVLQLSHLVIHSLDVGDVHVVGGGTNIFILLTREDVDTNQVDLREHKMQ